MRIKDILSPESMIMDLKAKNKEDAIKEMADLEVATDIVNDEDAFIKSSGTVKMNQLLVSVAELRCLTHVTSQSTRLVYYLLRVKMVLTITHLMVNQFTYSS